jgi:predicted dehydrogenase
MHTNVSHFDIARAFLEAGIAAVCEKPLTNDSGTAAELVAIAEANNAILAVPHIYSAYPMVRHAARMVRDGDPGRIRFVAAEQHRAGRQQTSNNGGWIPQGAAAPLPSPTSARTRFTCCN